MDSKAHHDLAGPLGPFSARCHLVAHSSKVSLAQARLANAVHMTQQHQSYMLLCHSQVCIYKGFCVKEGHFAIIMKLYSCSLAARIARHPGKADTVSKRGRYPLKWTHAI